MILHRYFAGRFMRVFAGVFGVFFLLMLFFDIVEQLRMLGRINVSFSELIELTLLNVPEALYRILPLIMVLSSITLFLGLARSSEMVVTRAAGRSALRALMGPGLVAFFIGCIAVAALNPIVAATSKEYESRINHLNGRGQALSLTSDGLWLRQGTDESQTVIRAKSASLDGSDLQNVSFLTFRKSTGPIRRIEAARAVLGDGKWALTDAKIWTLETIDNPEAESSLYPTMELPTTLTVQEIRDSFGTPSSIPIWELPNFIRQLDRAGFTSRRHRVWFQSELSLPIYLLSMLLIGAAFTLRHQRGGGTGIMVLSAVLLSFGLYFVRNFAIILGESGQLPVELAVWAPPLAAIGLTLALVLHLEDG